MEKEQYQYITLPKRGLKIIAPENVSKLMERSKEGEIVTYPENEKKKLLLIRGCKILQQRYPSVDDGKAFMNDVDYSWREFLLGKAKHITNEIVNSYHQMASSKPFSVVLYGSVAKGLVKKPDHKDPSNIDLAIIGNINSKEREDLFDTLRPIRKNVQEEILSHCPVLESDEANPGNVGITIQNLEKVMSNNFAPVRNYISAGAIPLFDNYGLWQSLEELALENYSPPPRVIRR